MNDLAVPFHRALSPSISSAAPPRRQPSILVVEDGTGLGTAIRELCESLGIGVECPPSAEGFLRQLREQNPIAVLAELDGSEQDGCYVMMRVAEYDRSLPILLLTGADPALAGAAEAVEELWGLSAVQIRCSLPGAGELAEFLCCATRRDGRFSRPPKSVKYRADKTEAAVG